MTNKTKGDFNGMQKENARIEDKWTNFLFYIFVTIVVTLLVLGALSIIGYIVYFGYKMLDTHPVMGGVIMISPLIFIICAFQIGEYF